LVLDAGLAIDLLLVLDTGLTIDLLFVLLKVLDLNSDTDFDSDTGLISGLFKEFDLENGVKLLFIDLFIDLTNDLVLENGFVINLGIIFGFGFGKLLDICKSANVSLSIICYIICIKNIYYSLLF